MKKDLLNIEHLELLVHVVRGNRVMLSKDLARLYGVTPRVLVQAVKRNRKRFPPDFMFLLDGKDVAFLKSQIVTSSWGGARREKPYAFTEQGVAMLSSVLRSERAIEVNIAIMRVFVKLREVMTAHRELADKLSELEQHIANHDVHIQNLFDAIQQLMTPPDSPSKQIGFHVKESRAAYGKRSVRRK